MNCPRDGTELQTRREHSIQIDHCATCNGRWLDYDELDQLEATVPSTEGDRRATVMYGERPGDLKCPVCEKQMTRFDYRAHAVEIDVCPDHHGYWLDSGEEGRVRDIIAERVRDLDRSASAEAGFKRFLGGIRKGLGGGRR